jgi:hypothetical protein
MRYVALAALAGVLVTRAGSGPGTSHAAANSEQVAHEVIAVYLGAEGTDAQSGMIAAVQELRVALARQAAATNRRFVLRGVSLEPSTEGGIRHLALLGHFDEISVGGNWTNSSALRYLGTSIGRDSTSAIPQVVLLERDIVEGQATLQVGPEREIGRFIGIAAIANWARRGAPLPQAGPRAHHGHGGL